MSTVSKWISSVGRTGGSLVEYWHWEENRSTTGHVVQLGYRHAMYRHGTVMYGGQAELGFDEEDTEGW